MNMDINNQFENLYQNLQEFKTSEIPEDRLFYLKGIKQFIEFGERIIRLAEKHQLDKREIEQTLTDLKNEIKGYKLYPKL